MTLQSMTGFAQGAGDHAGASFSWELKSVNSKGLEVRLRLPPGLERLEQPVRAALGARFVRGNIYANLSLSRASAQAVPVINEAVLQTVARAAQRLSEDYGFEPARADGILALRGVMEVPEFRETDEERAELDAAVMAALEEASAALQASRAGEGRALAGLLSGHVETIAGLTARAEADPSRAPASIAGRLAKQVALLASSAPQLDEERLHAEAAFLATKADIREELDRLLTHVAAARTLIAGGSPAGRKLDFLAQEFNREANTLCSKSNAAAVTAIGLELKVVIDQFREQVQNVE
ncbi:MAG: YicC family protein [Notoacmeibacter sp.]|nr:YicC family protein [Notoacmeibacter sp.]MCC0033122.1 YicC family protein [Brucellaceae bacterium]